MSVVEETIRRSASRRSGHGPRGGGGSGGGGGGGGSAGADWPAAASRGPAQPIPTVASSSSPASARPQDIAGPTRRQSSRDGSVDSAGQHTPPDHADLLFKVMLLGDSGVGKTCLLTRFRDGRFLAGNYITTVGIDFRNKVVTVDETPIKLQIWDTAGQERFRSVTHAYYRDAHALLLLYDVTNKTSYDNIRAWLSEIREHANEDVVIMLLGNKSDCGTERIVKREDGERLAREYKVPFMETSAKTGLNVELAFLAVARELKARKSDDPDETKFNVQDYVRQQSQRSSCFSSNCLTT
ncbi:ras-related protein Rab-37 isoform X4 [Harpegnathos saltator]|nr:ras-related protein Rab-37 isoform X4 [Harpegnathos saltator]XP_025159680.1 ras-related protein Rab-37 isoform X4 [Harpegnathos saltator]